MSTNGAGQGGRRIPSWSVGRSIRDSRAARVEGETLAGKLTRGKLTARETLRWGFQIAEALEAAHAKGIVHRDLKPANVMITTDGRVKVLDFGLAKALLLEPGLDSTAPTVKVAKLTETGVSMGTPPYMSPEQVRGEAVDKRTDIGAFGCLLYEALSGSMAFGRRTAVDTLAAIIEVEPDFEVLPASTPPGLRSLVSRCLRKDLGARLHDIADARIEIDEILQASGTTAAAHGPAGKRPKQRWIAIATASCWQGERSPRQASGGFGPEPRSLMCPPSPSFPSTISAPPTTSTSPLE